MSIAKIDAHLFKKMIINGAINLKNHQAEVDKLNVFPVPDGDTGTNMSMTMMSGVSEINALNTDSIRDITKSLSRGLLMGARGNSGVILSQFFRGVYLEIKDNEYTEINVNIMIDCLIRGYKVAYKSVMQPVEGTILTVVREAGESLDKERENIDSFETLFSIYEKTAKESLARTPELLPVLKEAGVVDSGATGFIKVLEGMVFALNGKMLESAEPVSYSVQKLEGNGTEETEIKFGYCTEFIVRLNDPENFEESDLRGPFSLLGDSLVLVVDEDLCKVHVHSNRPGRVLEIAQTFGEFVKIKVENMRLQHSELISEAEEQTPSGPKKMGIIVVCFGDGIKSTFLELGADYIIDGGQTMNPPTEEFVEAIQNVNAKNVLIIPNNSNVILAAEQAAKLVEEVNVKVIKAKTVPQGYSAIMSFDANYDLDTNYTEMSEALQNVGTGEVTYAVRDTELNGVKISVGDFIGISNNNIIVSTKDRLDASIALIEDLVDDDTAIVTVFCGVDADSNEVLAIESKVLEMNSDAEVEIIEGNQEIYSYIIAVE